MFCDGDNIFFCEAYSNVLICLYALIAETVLLVSSANHRRSRATQGDFGTG